MPVQLTKTRLEGSLAETPLDTLLEPCRTNLFTGTITVQANGQRGNLELRGGVVDEAKFGDKTGDAAVEALTRLRDGKWEVRQMLPDMAGGSTEVLEGSVAQTSVANLMRLCEENALSCTISVKSGSNHGEVSYRAGEITEVKWNGKRDDDAIVLIGEIREGQFTVLATPIEWPFKVEAGKPAEAAKPVEAPRPAPAPAPAPAAKPAPAPVAAAPVAAAAAAPVAAKPAPAPAPATEPKKPAEKKPVERPAEAKPAPAPAPERKPAPKAPVERPAHAPAAAAVGHHEEELPFSFAPIFWAAVVSAAITYVIVAYLY